VGWQNNRPVIGGPELSRDRPRPEQPRSTPWLYGICRCICSCNARGPWLSHHMNRLQSSWVTIPRRELPCTERGFLALQLWRCSRVRAESTWVHRYAPRPAEPTGTVPDEVTHCLVSAVRCPPLIRGPHASRVIMLIFWTDRVRCAVCFSGSVVAGMREQRRMNANASAALGKDAVGRGDGNVKSRGTTAKSSEAGCIRITVVVSG